MDMTPSQHQISGPSETLLFIWEGATCYRGATKVIAKGDSSPERGSGRAQVIGFVAALMVCECCSSANEAHGICLDYLPVVQRSQAAKVGLALS